MRGISRPPLMTYEHEALPCHCCGECGQGQACERHLRRHARQEIRRRGWTYRLRFWAWTVTQGEPSPCQAPWCTDCAAAQRGTSEARESAQPKADGS